MNAITDGMVLAAGLGLRMRPLTADCPKPLLMAGQETLLDHALRTLADGGMKRAVVNGHYLADQVRAHLAGYAGSLNVQFSDETAQLLETGGGVTKALDRLAGDAFAVLNADNIWVPGRRPVLANLLAHWRPEKMDALLLVVPLARAAGYDGPGDFLLDGNGLICRRTPPRLAPFAFAGVQILKRALFDGCSVEPFSLNRIYDKAMAAGRLFGVPHEGPWYHVGTPAALSLANAALGFHGPDHGEG